MLGVAVKVEQSGAQITGGSASRLSVKVGASPSIVK